MDDTSKRPAKPGNNAGPKPNRHSGGRGVPIIGEANAHVKPPGRIPAELTAARQWVCWRRELRGGKPTKIPYIADTGNRKASSTDPATWRTFDDACKHAARFDGIGFVFSADDPYCGIDLDHAVDTDTGEVHADALAILRDFPSYTEQSPSGSGLHILCRATLAGTGTKKPHGGIEVEMYDRKRYFTVTGKPWTDSPSVVADCQEAAANLYAEIKGTNGAKPPPAPRRAEPLSLSDEELLERARNAKNGAAFSALFDHGDTTGYAGASEADRALCAKLNFWTGNDPDHTERLARQSALCRPKWDSRRGDSTWIRREIEGTYQAETYQPHQRINGCIRGQTPEPGDGSPEGDNSMEALAIVSGGQTDEIRLTDLGNAGRLVRRHGHDLRFDHLRACWYVWTGQRWERDVTGEVERRAKDTVRAIYAEASEAEERDRAALAKHAIRSESKAAISNMISLAASEPGIPVIAADMNRDAWLLNCLNGTIDLRTGELHEHRREDMISKLAPVNYDPDATHPLWNDLLTRVTGGDTELLEYLQTAAGYSLTGTTREDKAFVLVSEGGGGKTSFLEPMARALGDYAAVAEESTFVARHTGAAGHSEDVAALDGARMVVATELGQGKLAEERFKRMTGGDTMRASRKHEQSFEFRPVFKLWLSANTAPTADDKDTGVWRRLRYIPWTPIPKHERDPAVKEILSDPAQAGAAVLAWMVRGCLKFQRDGLGDPPCITDATEVRRRENNPLAGFFEDCCVFGTDVWTAAGGLRAAYEAWCRETGTEAISGKKEWGERLREKGAEPGYSPTRARIWRGIGLCSEPDFNAPYNSTTVVHDKTPYVRTSDFSHEGKGISTVTNRCTVVPDAESPPAERESDGDLWETVDEIEAVTE